MALGFLYKALTGSIITSFAIVPALADPKAFLESAHVWWANIQPVLDQIIGGVI